MVLPLGLPELKRLFEDALSADAIRRLGRKAVEEKRPTDDDYDRVRRVLTFSPGKSEVTREQVRELTEAFRDAAAGRPARAPAVEMTPMPEVAATPSP